MNLRSVEQYQGDGKKMSCYQTTKKQILPTADIEVPFKFYARIGDQRLRSIVKDKIEY